MRRLLKDDELVDAVVADFEAAQLGDRRLAMLRYVAKLTRDPASLEERDVDALRDAGFGDRDILQICEVASYYAYVNRIADGLGVELEHE